MNPKSIINLVMYLAIFISGLIITIALGKTTSNFDGNCILYLEETRFGSSSTCDYVIYMPVVTCIIFPFIMFLILIYSIIQLHKGNSEVLNYIETPMILILNAISFILVFVGACMVSVGRNTMCSTLMDKFKLDSCYQAQISSSNKNSFVQDIVLAEITAWICLIWWIFLIAPDVATFWRKGDLSTKAESKMRQFSQILQRNNANVQT